MSELFDAVDALVASRSPLPPPAERRRLRQAHGLTLDEVAAALQVRRATVGGWEAGKTEPRPPEREAYARLLDKLAELYPADLNATSPVEDTAVPDMRGAATETEVPHTSAGPSASAPPAEKARSVSTGSAPAGAAMTEPPT
ncbi:helix-turn-helix domain-containing protein [Streptomyces scabiei]